jgi:GT2 family glycosyltransferase
MGYSQPDGRSSGSSAELSYVLASHNSWRHLDACLSSFPEAGVPDYEIVVVDNASTDGTPELLKQHYPRVRLFLNAKNVGHCGAVNQGLQHAHGEYIAVLDADTVLDPLASYDLLNFLRSNREVAIAAPRMLNPDGSIQETARSFPAFWNGIFGRQSLITRLFPNNPFARNYLRKDALQATTPFQVDWVSAAFMMFHRSLPERVGSFDEGYQGYWVDADWCKTAQAAGSVYCVPSARVVHHEQNRTGRKKGRARIILFHQGAYRFYRKHSTFGRLDPRAIVAGAALFTRCALLLAADRFRPDSNPKAKSAARASARAGAKRCKPALTSQLQQEKE